jgi:hypothetical protein
MKKFAKDVGLLQIVGEAIAMLLFLDIPMPQ